MRCYRLSVALLLQFAALLLAPAAIAAPPASAAIAAPTHIAAALVTEAPAAPGTTATLAIAMTPAPGWHGYWQNPGDAGLGMTLDWTLPAGASAGPPRYPVPDTLLIAGLMNHVYEHAYALLVPITVPAGAGVGSALPVTVKAQWLACTVQICVPESAELHGSIQVGGAGARDPRFDAWRAALAPPLGSVAQFALAGERLRLAIPLPASVPLDAPHVFVSDPHVVDYAAPQNFSRAGDTLIVELARAKFASVAPQTLGAVLRLDRAGSGLTLSAAPGPVPPAGTPLDAAGSAGNFGWLLLSALLGGILLNVMPCVFPILSLKALSLLRAGESEAQARAEGLAYSGGVILASLGLGALLLALRAGGQQVGWAFQLQEPLVVAALALLAAAITANLAGLYEFAVPGFVNSAAPRNSGGTMGAFGTGLLAAFAATPCTGPFMAAAMGAALLLPTAQAMALFGALGLGLALPFLALAYVPALRRMLPRPGAWMNWFRKAMALPMGLTALALVWLASRLAGGLFAVLLCAFIAGIVGALFAAGARQRRGVAARAPAGSALVLAVSALLALGSTVRTPVSAEAGVLPAQPFSEAALTSARAAGHPVFVYFTADWCLSCKVNERVSIEREPTRAAFAQAGVTVLKGDWTRRDPVIGRFLSDHGAAGVPLYLWYPPHREAQQLPQVLGPDALVDLARAK